tara:strand:+ start:468 stop:854 length:387 start_codon:yes stop_codon:yes gene_type:complete
LFIGYQIHGYFLSGKLQEQKADHIIGQAGLIGLITSGLVSLEEAEGEDIQRFINGALVLEAEKFKEFAESSSHSSAEFVGSVSETIEEYLIKNPSKPCISTPPQEVYNCEYKLKIGQLNKVLDNLVVK